MFSTLSSPQIPTGWGWGIEGRKVEPPHSKNLATTSTLPPRFSVKDESRKVHPQKYHFIKFKSLCQKLPLAFFSLLD